MGRRDRMEGYRGGLKEHIPLLAGSLKKTKLIADVNKRIAVVLLVVLVTGLTFLGYFLHQSRKTLSTDPYKAVTPDASIIIETVDIQSLFNSLTTGKGLFSEIGKIKEFRAFDLKLNYIADLFNKPEFNRIFLEGRSVISFHPSEKGKFTPFLSMTLPAGLTSRQLKESLLSLGAGGISVKVVNRKQLLELPFTLENQKDTAFVCINSGLLLCSPSKKLITTALMQSAPGADIRTSPGFSKVLLSTGKNKDKIFVVFTNLSEALSSVFSPGRGSLADKISNFGECSGGDLIINDEGLTVSGYLESSDPSEFFFRYRGLEPRELKSFKVLPAATAFFESAVLIKNFNSGVGKSIASQESISLAERLKPYLGDEITRAYIDIRSMPVMENSIIVMELKNPVQCEKILAGNFRDNIKISYFQPDEQVKIPIYFTGRAGLIPVFRPDLSADFTDSYFTFYDNYMIAGNSEITLSRFLYDNILNKTLANDIFYHEFEKILPSRSGYLLYCNPSRALDYLARYFNDDIISRLRSNRISLNKVQSTGFQLASINSMLYNSLSLRYKEEVPEESTTEWETLLDTTASIKPFFFKNHITGAREIFIQDMNNNAYLINAAGRVLWKVALREKIMSTVYMIDYYRNGKYQLLFSGRNFLHVIDRNGNYVERYPVRLRSPATNSLALFDYDNNNTYRLVIAGEDKMLYSYDKSGSVVKGWIPFRTAGYVTSEAVFYKVSGKDYIVVADESSLYFLDRFGNVRFTPNDAVTKSRASTIRLATGSEQSLVCTSPEGTVQNIFFNGEVKKFNPGSFSVDHSFDFFDIDGDGFGEYIFIDKGILYLYDHDRRLMFSKEFSSAKLGGPIIFIFSSADRKVGVFDIEKNLIYLIGKEGEIMKGFPLRGASMFSIGKLSAGNDWHLIVGGTDRFLYNYKLETSEK